MISSYSKIFLLLILFIYLPIQISATCNCVNGTCNAFNRCSCFPGYLSIDCSVPATKLEIGTTQSGINYNNKAYFYYPITDAPGTLSLVFTKPNDTNARVLVTYVHNENYILQDISMGDSFPSGSTEAEREISQRRLGSYINERKVMIGISADKKLDEITIQTSWKEKEEVKVHAVFLLTILVPLGVMFILGILVVPYLILRRRYLRRPSQYNAPSTGFQLEQVLSKEEIDTYFPKKEFSQVTNPNGRKDCCICLDGFETNPVCRQLYCGHFHHDECIEKWLEKHATCPDCRKPMTVKAIKEFLEDQTQEKKLDDEESIPINHPADVVTMQS